MLDDLKLDKTTELICGFSLKSLQHLNLFEVNEISVLPKLWVEAKLRFILNENLDFCTPLSFLSSIPNYTPITLELYHSSDEDDVGILHLSDEKLLKILENLNVVSFKITNVKTQDEVSIIMEILEDTKSSWSSLKNISIQLRYQTSKPLS